MQPTAAEATFKIEVQFRSPEDISVEIPGVASVELISKQDDQGRAVFFYSVKGAAGQDLGSFPFDAVGGWWRTE
jgi:hypothetical protein